MRLNARRLRCCCPKGGEKGEPGLRIHKPSTNTHMKLANTRWNRVEHGHDNNYENDYTSVAYWYQLEPHAAFPSLPEARARLPRFPESVLRADAARAKLRQRMHRLQEAGGDSETVKRLGKAFRSGCKALLDGRPEDAAAIFESE